MVIRKDLPITINHCDVCWLYGCIHICFASHRGETFETFWAAVCFKAHQGLTASELVISLKIHLNLCEYVCTGTLRFNAGELMHFKWTKHVLWETGTLAGAEVAVCVFLLIMTDYHYSYIPNKQQRSHPDRVVAGDLHACLWSLLPSFVQYLQCTTRGKNTLELIYSS